MVHFNINVESYQLSKQLVLAGENLHKNNLWLASITIIQLVLVFL